MQDPWNHIEYARAELPDGRLLLIERERAPRLGRRGQMFLEIGFAVAMIYLIPQLMQITDVFGNYWLWAFIAFAIAYVALSLIILEKLTTWASEPPDDPAGCKVVGLELSTDELISIMRGEPPVDASQWSFH